MIALQDQTGLDAIVPGAAANLLVFAGVSLSTRDRLTVS